MSIQKMQLRSSIEEQSYTSEDSEDAWTQTRVKGPEDVLADWGLSYGDYVRVSVSGVEGEPRIAFAPMHHSSGSRANDFMMPSNGRLPMPRWLIRAFGVREGIHWEEVDQQLVGTFEKYNDGRVLYAVADHYLPNHLVIPHKDEEEVGTERFTTFDNMADIAKVVERNTDAKPYRIHWRNGSYVHDIPESFNLDTSGEKDYAFVLFHDSQGFVIGLIPYDEDKDDEESDDKGMVFRYQYHPMSASPYDNEVDRAASALPTIVLSYDEIKRTPTRDKETGNVYYTVPKQIASLMWFRDGVTSDWLMIGDAAFARLIPENSTKSRERVATDTIPTALPWE
jgi:hypothetical protein